MDQKAKASTQRHHSFFVDKNMTPVVSIIMPAFNREKYIAESIQSALAQSFKDFELIIIDDGSTDKTLEIAKTFETDPRVHVVKNEKNMGIAKTRNRGLELAKADLIAPLDSDDVWLDVNKLQKQVDFLKANSDYCLLGGGIMHIDTDSKHVKKVLYPVYDSTIRKIILQFNPFPQSTLLYRKKVALACGGYSSDYEICDDYDLWLKMGLRNKFTNIPQILAGYRIHGGNITRTKRLTTAREILDIVKQFSNKYPHSLIGIAKAYVRLLLAYVRS
jgi:glycosyltransferase involved in cell wall biosynthesis